MIIITINSYSQCSGIDKSYDKFYGQTSFEFEIKSGSNSLTFTKRFYNGTIQYSCYICAMAGDTYFGTGVKFLLESNGMRLMIDKESEVETMYAGSHYWVTSSVYFSEDEIQKIKIVGISSLRIGIYDVNFNESKIEKMKDKLGCLINSNI